LNGCAQRIVFLGTAIMTQNLGDADRTLRLMAGAVLSLIFSNMPNNTTSAVVGIVAIIFFISGLSGWSVFYAVFRISTRSEKDAKPLIRS
jgi:DUF2892 family protein